MTREEIRALSDFDLNCELLQHDASWSIVPMPPDYCNSIDELHAIESTLTPKQWARYVTDLIRDQNNMPVEQYEAICEHYPPEATSLICGAWYVMNATPRQRAEALLWVLMEQPL